MADQVDRNGLIEAAFRVSEERFSGAPGAVSGSGIRSTVKLFGCDSMTPFPSVETTCWLVADAILFCHDPEDSLGVRVPVTRFE